MGTWKVKEAVELNAENLQRLFDNEVAAIRIEKFATLEDCKIFADAMRTVSLKYQTYHEEIPDKVGFIGTGVYEFLLKSKEEYFEAVDEGYAHQRQVIDQAWDPVQRMVETLQAHTQETVGRAAENGRKYFAGVIRNTSGGVKLHADFAPSDAPDYLISEINGQVTWNLYVEATKRGGVLTVHNSPWSVDPKAGEIVHNYPLPKSMVTGADRFESETVVGDVVIFNTQNPHEISDGGWDEKHGRLQVGSFVGRMPNGDLILWS